jgi:spermidine synthase
VSRAGLVAVAVLSAAILAYEVLLMRLFSIIWWHHFAYMIISVALLGFGASGTALALARERLMPRFAAWFAAGAALFGVTAVLCFAVSMRLPFNALAILWEPEQFLWLGLAYALLVLPFFFGGGAIGLAFSRAPDQIGRTYAYDLVGAGLGALGIVTLLLVLPADAALRCVASLGFLSAALALAPFRGRRTQVASVALTTAALLVLACLPTGLLSLHPQISEYKGLRTALLVPDARVVQERSHPLGLVSVVESPTVPFRHAPGMSLNYIGEPPAQIGVFTDADSMTAITRFNGDLASLEFLDHTTSALPYHLLREPEVLVLGAGGGEQVLLALFHQARKVDAVELHPHVAGLVAGDYADFAGGLYARPDVDVHIREARSFAQSTGDRFDLIQAPVLGSPGAGATQGLHENYTLTVEGLRDFLNIMEPDGILSVTLWLKLPPRDAPKLLATVITALEQLGVREPGEHIALIRSWKTMTLIAKKTPLTDEETARVRAFADVRSFDVSYLPGIAAAEANRYNILEGEPFHNAAMALLGPGRQDFIEHYKFAIAAATDDRPYFFDFFRWRSLPELFALRTQGAASMLDMGYLMLFSTLAQAVVLSILLILAPLVLRRRHFGSTAPKARVMAYFLALGLGFLLLEIAFIQRFSLFLGHPLYSVAVMLTGFLVFAGAGSALSSATMHAFARSSERSWTALGPLPAIAAGIAALAVVYILVLPPIFDALIELPDPAKIAISLALVAPLACLMGMPFPIGIAHLARDNQDLVPWAWAINGCASVVAAVLATLLAMHFGFTGVVLLAAAIYLAAPAALAGVGIFLPEPRTATASDSGR